MRSEVVPTSTLEPPVFEEKVKLAREIAGVLRTNIVQGRKVEEPTDADGRATWSA